MFNTSMIVFANADTESKCKTLASGAKTETYLDRKAYGQLKGVKGAELKRQHEAYRIARGTVANQNVASLLAGGSIIIEKATYNKDNTGGSFKFTNVNQFESASTEKQVENALAAHNAKLIASMKKSGMSDEAIATVMNG